MENGPSIRSFFEFDGKATIVPEDLYKCPIDKGAYGKVFKVELNGVP